MVISFSAKTLDTHTGLAIISGKIGTITIYGALIVKGHLAVMNERLNVIFMCEECKEKKNGKIMTTLPHNPWAGSEHA